MFRLAGRFSRQRRQLIFRCRKHSRPHSGHKREAEVELQQDEDAEQREQQRGDEAHLRQGKAFGQFFASCAAAISRLTRDTESPQRAASAVIVTPSSV